MDGERFDTWMRALARGVARRGVLKGLAVGVVAGSLTHTVQRHVGACTNTEGAACDPMMGCCDGLVCDDGICLVLGGNQCQTQDPETNECVPAQGQANCEGRGCKKKRKKGKKDRKGEKRGRGRE